MMMWGWSLGPWMIFGWVLMLLFWAGIIGLVVWGISTLTKRSGSEAKATGQYDQNEKDRGASQRD